LPEAASVFYSNPADAAIDADALRTLTDAYGERATRLPPVALVIAAYNEEGAVGPVVEALPRTLCGLAAEVIVVADGCADATAKESDVAGAIVADVPVNRGQGAALRLGYRIAREGGAKYIITTDADGQYNPAEMPLLLQPIIDGWAAKRPRTPSARPACGSSAPWCPCSPARRSATRPSACARCAPR
jgi:glycosyltransferase involved in cell wall biosynthesis